MNPRSSRQPVGALSDRPRFTLILPLLAGLTMLLAGCTPSGGTWKWHRDVAIGPDSRTVVYAQSSGASVGGLVGSSRTGSAFLGPALRSDEIVWFPADHPDQTHRFVFDAGLADWASDWGLRFFSFAPDGRSVALVGYLKACVLDLQTGKARPLHLGGLPMEFNSRCFGWLSTDEVVYWTDRSRIRGDGPWHTREVFRQKIGQPSWRRTRVFWEESGQPGPIVLSPNGQWALLAGSPVQGLPPRLLNTTTGHVRAVDVPNRSGLVESAWRPDSRILALLCHIESPDARNREASGNREARLIFEPMEGSGQIRTERSLTLPQPAEPEWTADGEFLVLDAGRRFYGLVRYATCRVIPLMDRLGHLRADGQPDNWEVRPLVPGWLWLRNWTGQGVRNLAVDYAGRTIVPMTQAKAWSLSRDGRYIAEVDESNANAPHVVVRPLDLPTRPSILADSSS